MAFAASAFVRANSSAAALDIPGSKRTVGDVTLLTRTQGKLAWHRTPVIRS